MQAARIVVIAPPGSDSRLRRDLGEEVRDDLEPLRHDVRWILRHGDARRIRAELREAVDDGRYPGLAVDEHGVEEADDQQLLDQAEKQALEVVLPEELRRTPGEVQVART